MANVVWTKIKQWLFAAVVFITDRIITRYGVPIIANYKCDFALWFFFRLYLLFNMVLTVLLIACAVKPFRPYAARLPYQPKVWHVVMLWVYLIALAALRQSIKGLIAHTRVAALWREPPRRRVTIGRATRLMALLTVEDDLEWQ